jgi:hypothetical protein
MAFEELTVPPRDNLSCPGQRAGRGMLSKPHWSVVIVFRTFLRHGSIITEEPLEQR